MADNCALIPEGYDEFIRVLKERIRTVQMKAALAVNREPFCFIGGSVRLKAISSTGRAGDS